MKKEKNRRGRLGFLRSHSLSLVALGILLLWTFLYSRSDPKTHAGAFYGNAIADWTGTVFIVIGTKYLFERGSVESRRTPRHRKNMLAGLVLEHSLTIVLFVTGAGWLVFYINQDPGSKWGQVVGNVLSEWVQMIGIVLLTKRLVERGSKESHS